MLRNICSALIYHLCLMAAMPLHWVFRFLKTQPTERNSVLHVSYMVHVPFYTVQILREHGMRADFLAVGSSNVWNQCDYQFQSSRWPIVRFCQEFRLVWKVLTRYEIIHLHFARPVTAIGWELPVLKRLGHKVVVHYRGCEIRNRERNMTLHADCNVCQRCDYNATICRSVATGLRRRLADRFADHVLVTTPDLLDFVPDATWLPLFVLQQSVGAPSNHRPPSATGQPLRIVHATNHPGIDGSDRIQEAIDQLKDLGYDLDFLYLRGVSHDRVLAELASADLAIGKMKMGYYANMQIEAMAMGVPTITYLRPEFATDELRDSGFIFSSLDNLKSTLEHYLQHPDQLANKREQARSSISRLHDNSSIARQLISLYHE